MFTVPKNKFRFNQYGHHIVMVMGSGLTGEQEICLLEIVGCCVGDHAKQMLREKSYDEQRLREGHQYEVVLLPRLCIPGSANCTPAELCRKANKMFGYGEPLAGIGSYLCEPMIGEQMREMGFGHISVPHKPICAADFNPYILEVNCIRKPFLDSYSGFSHRRLGTDVMLAFFSSHQ